MVAAILRAQTACGTRSPTEGGGDIYTERFPVSRFPGFPVFLVSGFRASNVQIGSVIRLQTPLKGAIAFLGQIDTYQVIVTTKKYC